MINSSACKINKITLNLASSSFFMKLKKKKKFIAADSNQLKMGGSSMIQSNIKYNEIDTPTTRTDQREGILKGRNLDVFFFLHADYIG